MILSLILVALAGFFKAVADTLADHFDTSIFKKLNPKFWHKATSSEYAKRIFGYKLDGWHLANSLMIFSFVAAASDSLIDFIILGVLFNIVFNLEYNKILRW